MLKQTYNQQIINTFQQELSMLRSLVIGTVGKDKEGSYSPKFVKKILKASEEKPTYVFKDKDSFLKQLG